MSGQAIQAYLKLHKKTLDEIINLELTQRKGEAGEISPHLVPVIQAMQELSVGGKRMRGLLTLLGYEIAGGKISREIIKAGAVMEIFHLGLLCQDDVSDRDNKRRGVPTVHARYEDQHLGESLAFYAGDLTFGWGMEVITRLNLPTTNLNQAIGVWGKYFTRVGYGQMLDVMGEHRGGNDEKEILRVLQLKSGEYSCVLPLVLGATLAGGNQVIVDQLVKYGMELGWVFQLRDDWLSEWGDSEKTGKPVGNDRREGRKSYATKYGKEATEKAIQDHLEQGIIEINSLLGDSRKVLEEMIEWMATRDN